MFLQESVGTATDCQEDINKNLVSEVAQTNETRMINAEDLELIEDVLLRDGILTSDRSALQFLRDKPDTTYV